MILWLWRYWGRPEQKCLPAPHQQPRVLNGLLTGVALHVSSGFQSGLALCNDDYCKDVQVHLLDVHWQLSSQADQYGCRMVHERQLPEGTTEGILCNSNNALLEGLITNVFVVTGVPV